MELLQLRYFCVVAKYENITRAANELMIAQPSLSKTIKKLENELGTTLFNRRGRYLKINQFGSKFYRHVSASLRILDDAIQEIHDMAGNISGSVTVLVTAGINIFPRLLHKFKQQYPFIEVRMIIPITGLSFCSGQNYDIVFWGTPDELESNNKILLMENEEMVLAVPNGHPLAKYEAVHLREAASYPFISYSKYSSIHLLLIQLCQDAGFVPKIMFESDNTLTHLYLIRSGMGISLVPVLTMSDLFSEEIVPVRISSPHSSRKIWMAWNCANYISEAMKLFRNFCVDFFFNLKNPLS